MKGRKSRVEGEGKAENGKGREGRPEALYEKM